jgi:hypothetical protein
VQAPAVLNTKSVDMAMLISMTSVPGTPEITLSDYNLPVVINS